MSPQTWDGREITDADIAERLKKPARGSQRTDRDDAKRQSRSFEDGEKKKVRARDTAAPCRGCRWPMCRHRGEKRPLEVAHMKAKGVGGDHGVRSSSDQMILLCYWHHQADPQEGHPEGSIERHNLKIEPLTDLGTNGPVAFYRERVRTGPKGLHQAWVLVARERAVGVLEGSR